MKFILLLYIACVWHYMVVGESRRKDIAASFLEGGKAILTTAAKVTKIALDALPFVPKLIFGKCVDPPSSCPSEYITFWYYERYKASEGVQILNSNYPFTKSNNPWKVIIHGYRLSRKESPNMELIPEYFKNGNYNIIAVDYSPLGMNGCYPQAADSVPIIARCTARLLDRLINSGYLTLQNLHIIGFSLGAQVAGRIHKYLTNGRPKRITGLDPASPLFDGVLSDRLTEKSAEFVDVIHTNGLLAGEFLLSGHVDFYVNGGAAQPGCLFKLKEIFTCNHKRSPKYFAESINSPVGFWGIPCPHYPIFLSGACNTIEALLIPMGEHVPHTARGVYYLQTKSKPPFAMGKRTSHTFF